jgi:hypothetical protein
LLAAAQTLLLHQQLTALNIAGLLTGLGLWVATLRGAARLQDKPDALVAPARAPRIVLGGMAIIGIAGAFANTDGNVFRPAGVVPWLAAIGLWLAAWWPAGPRQEPAPARTHWRRRAIVLAPLAVIVVVGACFRFYRLAETPSDPTQDHAEKLLDIQDLLDGQRPIYFPRNTGREPAQFYFTLTLINEFGLPPNYDTLKLGTALVDTLAIPAVFLLATEMGGPATGLLAAAFYSVGKWPLAIARAGLRYPYAPLPTALALWALFRYLRRGDRRDALLCGISLGAGLYGYSPFRAVTLVIPAVTLIALCFDERWRGRRKELVGHGLLIAATAALVFLPLGHYMLERPDIFWYRAGTRIVSADRYVGNDQIALLFEQLLVFLQNNLHAALAFNWRGDSSRVGMVVDDPFLDPIAGAAFLAGMAMLSYQVIVRRDVRSASMIVALPLLMLSSTLAIAFPEENPSAVRGGPAAPLVFTIAALALALALRRLMSPGRLAGVALAALALGLLLVLAAQHDYERYFVEYDAQYRAFVPNTSEVVKAISSAAAQGVDRDHAFIFAAPRWLDTHNVGIKLGDIDWAERHTVNERDPLPEQADSRPLLLVINKADQRHVQAVRQRWPNGTLTYVPSAISDSKDFYTFLVPGKPYSEPAPTVERSDDRR